MPNKVATLEPGDILLYRVTEHSAFYDKLIAIGQTLFYQVPRNARFCHIAIVDKDTNYKLEAVWPKTRRSLIAGDNAGEIMEVYRVKYITDDQVVSALAWANANLNEWYDILFLLTGWIDVKHAEICSTFVSHAFAAAGLLIPHVPKLQKIILPDDYADDKQLARVP